MIVASYDMGYDIYGYVLPVAKKDRKYIPINLSVFDRSSEKEYKLAFHAVTGSNTTSKLATIRKPAVWNRYVSYSLDFETSHCRNNCDS